MARQFAKAVSAVLLLCAGNIFFPAPVRAEYEKTERGICVKVGEMQMEASAPTQGLFSLNIAYGKKPEFIPSIFLGSLTADAWEPVTQGNKVGIKTKSGQLLIDQSNGQWVLLDSTGATVLAQSPSTRLQKEGVPSEQVEMDITLPKDPSFQIYSSGNNDPKKGQLLQVDGDSRMGNGMVVVPYYWCTANYGVFGVSSNDDIPAKWKKDAEKGFITWRFTGQTACLYLVPAKSLYESTQGYTALTGRPIVPPKWSFGYLQSRWGWVDKKYIDDALKNFHDRSLPVDAFILDFECYTKTPDYSLKEEGEAGYSDFDWNPELLPNAAANIADYRRQGLRIVPIRKPRIGNKATLDMMRSKNWILSAGGNGEVEALMNKRDLDFRKPELRTWYADRLETMMKDGVAGWWNDEGESSYTKYFYWNLAQVEMLKKFDPNMRHWSLNRSFTPGLQRLGGAAWTGDVRSSWEVLMKTPTSLLNWGLVGMPYGACDIGGYKTNPDGKGGRPLEIPPELLTRWMQAGVFMPIMRSHSARRMIPRFPWLYGPEAEAAIRKALELRYRLIPFYYSLAHETYATGSPFMRPLVMEFPTDPKVQNLSDQWLMGTGLMAAPLLSQGGNRKVYFPDDMQTFNDTQTFKRGEEIQITAAKLDEIPLYVRKGTILPLGPVVQNTDQLPGGPLEVQIYPGKDATFTFVEDDGVSNDYLQGKLRKTTFAWDDTHHTLKWTQEGSYAGKDIFTKIKAVVLYPTGKIEASADLTNTGTLTLAEK